MAARHTKTLQIEIEAVAIDVGADVYLSQKSVVEALRRVASELEGAGSVELAPRQFREAARAFAGLEEASPPRERRRLFGRRA